MNTKRGRIFAFTLGACMVLVIAIFVVFTRDDLRAAGGTFYVAVSGSDNNPGTLASPWKTLSYAFERLNPGDTLYLRDGTYFESVTMSKSGTASQPITIMSYPGERAVIDSGTPLFRTPGNNDWPDQPVSATTGEYCSVTSGFDSQDESAWGITWGYLTGVSYENERYMLVPYTRNAQFQSTSESAGNYVGPGVFAKNGKICVRLDKTQDMIEAESRYGWTFFPDKAHPKNYSIVLSQADYTLRALGSYVNFKNVTVNQAKTTVEVSGSNITFDGVEIWIGSTGIDGTGSYVKVTNSRILGDSPAFISWNDRKVDGYAGFDSLRGVGIGLFDGAHDWEISYNLIRGGHDGLGVDNDEKRIIIHHNWIGHFDDDCFEIEGTTDIGRIEMYENYFENCLTVLSVGQDSAKITGPILFYRNVVNFLRNPYVNRSGGGTQTWNGGGKYGYEYMFKQGGNYKTGNIHYTHNTIALLNSGSGQGLNITRMTTPAGSTIANNIFISVLGNVNKTYPSGGSGALIDGNLYWKVVPRISGQSSFDTLLGATTTVPGLTLATGFEQNGKGSVAYEGTNPEFQSLAFPSLSADSNPIQRRFVLGAFESHAFADFILKTTSLACDTGVILGGRTTATSTGAAVEPLKDSRGFDRDLGAIPCGTSASEYNYFPFNLAAAPPTSPPTPPPTPPSVPPTPPTPPTTPPSPLDTIPPVRSGSSPSGTLPSNTTSVTLRFSTNEDATCRIGTAPGIDFASKTTTMSSTGARTHTHSISVSAGQSYAYYARCRDSAGNVNADDFVISFSVAPSTPPPTTDTTPPTVSVTAPTESARVAGTVTISANASDNTRVAGVKFYIDQTQVGAEDTLSLYAISWDTRAVADGTHRITAVARDSSGNTTESAVRTVTVANTTPPPSGAFNTGDRVRTTESVNVRGTPSLSGTVMGVQQIGALGTVKSGGSSVADGHTWWNIDYDVAPDGWTAEQFLARTTAGALCGNGVVDTGEACDGGNLNGASCASRGFTGGTLACTSNCAFNTSQCTGKSTVSACDALRIQLDATVQVFSRASDNMTATMDRTAAQQIASLTVYYEREIKNINLFSENVLRAVSSWERNATTDTRRKAVADFLAAVTVLLNQRSSVLTNAVTAYRDGTLALLESRRDAVVGAYEAREAAVRGAAEAAVSSCTAGTPVATARAEFGRAMSASAATFGQALRTAYTDYANGLRNIITARLTAYRTAYTGYSTAYREAFAVFLAAYYAR